MLHAHANLTVKIKSVDTMDVWELVEPVVKVLFVLKGNAVPQVVKANSVEMTDVVVHVVVAVKISTVLLTVNVPNVHVKEKYAVMMDVEIRVEHALMGNCVTPKPDNVWIQHLLAVNPRVVLVAKNVTRNA